MTRLGILSALPQEARVITRTSELGEPLQVSEGLVFVRSGIGENNALRSANLLCATEVDALISFGVCGGIDPGLKTGDLLLPASVSNGMEVINVSPRWRAALHERLGVGHSATATQLHVSKPVTGVEEKKALFENTGAQGVDMESFAVAQVAGEAGVPFIVLRVVLDDARTRLPELALDATNEHGVVQFRRLLTGLLRYPQDIPALVRIAYQFRRAIKVLQVTRQQAGPLFLYDHA